MDIVLVPGLWLDGGSWDDVAAKITTAGHRPHPVTLPGRDDPHADRSTLTLADHVAAVVAVIDSCSTPVILVGHSAGSGSPTRPSIAGPTESSERSWAAASPLPPVSPWPVGSRSPTEPSPCPVGRLRPGGPGREEHWGWTFSPEWDAVDDRPRG